ncbi:putative F-box domain-containing protein [Medicago truncatula]|uniref:F-box protein interaction domain protein n=1 Tax=Medicago truncatula TaxID=3880 RepID=G7KLN7_MEDTR|nr:F-box protein interaction domain protein [Medicago truncatula]RHN52526.1 putative F-box domain-containing protein [Medicago truncatula]
MEKTTTLASTKNEMVSTHIPDDIHFSILSKLPLQSLKRFESVRKSWSLLFENTHFMNMFRNDFITNPRRSCSYYNEASPLLSVFEDDKKVLYYLYGERFKNKFKLDWFNSSQEHFRIFGFGSINGTLCLYDFSNDNQGNIGLWNPTTQTTILSPPSLAISLVESILDHDEDMDFDGIFYNLHGFGYDRVTKDYKVIRYVWFTLEYLEPLWEIYSLRSNMWRELYVDMPYSLDCIDGTQVYMDGVCHWLSEEDSNEESCLVSFYFSNEGFFTTPLPSEVEDWSDDLALWLNLAVLNGSIALVSYHKETTNFHISILGDFGVKESWTKLFIVGPLSCVKRPIGVGTKGEIFFIRKDEELVWLDLSTQMIEEVGYKANNPNCSIIVYKEDILKEIYDCGY